MQTLDEVLSNYLVITQSLEEAMELEKSAQELQGKTKGLIEEVSSNPKAILLVGFYIRTLASCSSYEEYEEQLMYMFAHAVVIGIQMEKQE
jgi:hypothetical protein